MKHPAFEIQIATNSVDTRILLNGEDISKHVKALKIVQIAGRLPVVTLELVCGINGATALAKCNAILQLQDDIETTQNEFDAEIEKIPPPEI